MTATSSHSLQNTADPCSPVPSGASGQRKGDGTASCPFLLIVVRGHYNCVSSAKGRQEKDQTGTQVSPSWGWIAGTQATSLPTLSLAACRSQWLCLASAPSSCLARDTMRQLHGLIARCVPSLSLGSHSEATAEPWDSLNIQPFLIYPVVISLTCNLVIPAAVRTLT